MLSDIQQEKKELRQRIYALQKSLPESYFSDKDTELEAALMAHQKVRESHTVLSYWSMPREAKTHAINQQLLKMGKEVLLPVIKGNELEIKRFEGIESMRPEPRFGILEPTGEAFAAFEKVELVLVPGLAFTPDGHRCGHGKGYYDRLLPKLINAYTIGIGYHFQQVNYIPCNKFDQPMHETVIA